jgi:hypothetical protein
MVSRKNKTTKTKRRKSMKKRGGVKETGWKEYSKQKKEEEELKHNNRLKAAKFAGSNLNTIKELEQRKLDRSYYYNHPEEIEKIPIIREYEWRLLSIFEQKFDELIKQDEEEKRKKNEANAKRIREQKAINNGNNEFNNGLHLKPLASNSTQTQANEIRIRALANHKKNQNNYMAQLKEQEELEKAKKKLEEEAKKKELVIPNSPRQRVNPELRQNILSKHFKQHI